MYFEVLLLAEWFIMELGYVLKYVLIWDHVL